MIPGLDSIIGGIVGTIGGLFTGWMETKKYRAETERLEKQWSHDKDRFAAETAAKREENAERSFIASVESGKEPDPFSLPEGSWKILSVPLVLAESLRRITRPALTWALVFAAYYNERMEPGAWMAVGWWFGSRASKWMQK